MAEDSISLIRASAEFVAASWHIFMPLLDQRMTHAQMNALLLSIQSGIFDMWIGVDESSKPRKVVGFTIASKYVTTAGGGQTYHMHYVYGFERLGMKVWKYGIETMCKYAKETGCDKFTTLTPFPEAVKWAKANGFTSKFYIEKEL